MVGGEGDEVGDECGGIWVGWLRCVVVVRFCWCVIVGIVVFELFVEVEVVGVY